MTKQTTITILVLFLTFLGTTAIAQQKRAYFYFEGDLETPIYLKIEDRMQPRLGENHFIVNDLGEGYTHFQILFQQNIYPPQNFLLYVPNEGHRGFILKKVEKNQFALYDLQQKRFILAGNTKNDDPPFTQQPQTDTVNVATVTNNTAADLSLPKFNPETHNNAPESIKSTTGEKNAGKKHKEQKTEKSSMAKRNHHLDDQLPLLNTDTTLNLGATSNSSKNKSRATTSKTPATGNGNFIPGVILNNNAQAEDARSNTLSGCTTAMDNNTFQDLATTFLGYGNDFDKMKFLKRRIKGQCFSTDQVKIIGLHLDMQSSRFEALKLLYPQTADKQNYKSLESLFNTQYLKSQFENLIQ